MTNGVEEAQAVHVRCESEGVPATDGDRLRLHDCLHGIVMTVDAVDLVSAIEAAFTHHERVFLMVMQGVGDEENPRDVTEMTTHLTL